MFKNRTKKKLYKSAELNLHCAAYVYGGIRADPPSPIPKTYYNDVSRAADLLQNAVQAYYRAYVDLYQDAPSAPDRGGYPQ